MSEGQPQGLKNKMKHLAMRVMRPGLLPVHARLDEVGREVGNLRNHMDSLESDRNKYESELEYWRWLVKKGGSEKGFGGPFERVFGRWTRDKMIKMGEFLSLPAVGQAGCIDDWAPGKSVVEIGAGPYPLIAAAAKGWKRCVAVDPIARGYVEEGLVPEAASHVVYVAARGESIPLPSASADLVVIENCLDHVRDPALVLGEIVRLLAPGGLMWLFVDLSNHVDHMHPHAMNEEKVRGLLKGAGFEPVRDEVTAHKAHPEAYGSYCGMLRKSPPVLRDTRAVGVHHVENLADVRVMVESGSELSLNGSGGGRPRN